MLRDFRVESPSSPGLRRLGLKALRVQESRVFGCTWTAGIRTLRVRGAALFFVVGGGGGLSAAAGADVGAEVFKLVLVQVPRAVCIKPPGKGFLILGFRV